MTSLDMSRYREGKDYSVLAMDFAMGLTIEVPTQRLSRLVPAPLNVLEVRPGIGLINIMVFNIPLGNNILSQECTELILNIHVAPDRRYAPVLPKVAMYTVRIGASSQEFIDNVFAADRYEILKAPIKVEIDRDALVLDVRDGAGNPILHLLPPQGVEPFYAPEQFYAQSFTVVDGQVCEAGNWFEFESFYSQKNLASCGEIFDNPFFDGIDLSGIGPRNYYMQMWSRPGSVGKETHIYLRSLEEVKSLYA